MHRILFYIISDLFEPQMEHFGAITLGNCRSSGNERVTPYSQEFQNWNLNTSCNSTTICIIIITTTTTTITTTTTTTTTTSDNNNIIAAFISMELNYFPFLIK